MIFFAKEFGSRCSATVQNFKSKGLSLKMMYEKSDLTERPVRKQNFSLILTLFFEIFDSK